MSESIELKDGRELKSKFTDLAVPSVITHLTEEWLAAKDRKWSLEGLQCHYGNVPFSCWNCLNIKDKPVFIKMSDYIRDYVEDSSRHTLETMWYLNDKFFDVNCPQMCKDYSVPDIFAEYERMTHLASFARRILVGPPQSYTYLHVDNLYTSAWNTCLYGSKLWLMIQPQFEVLQEGRESEKPDFVFDEVMKTGSMMQMIAYTEEHIEPNRKYFVFVQEPGDTVFIAAQWHHSVVNLTATVALTHAFVQPNHVDKYLKMALGL